MLVQSLSNSIRFSGCISVLSPDFLRTPEASSGRACNLKKAGSWIILHFWCSLHRDLKGTSLNHDIAELLVGTEVF